MKMRILTAGVGVVLVLHGFAAHVATARDSEGLLAQSTSSDSVSAQRVIPPTADPRLGSSAQGRTSGRMDMGRGLDTGRGLDAGRGLEFERNTSNRTRFGAGANRGNFEFGADAREKRERSVRRR